MKKIKICLILFIGILLCGCESWESIQENIPDEGIICNYDVDESFSGVGTVEYDQDGKDAISKYKKIKTIKWEITKRNVMVIYNGSSNRILIDPSENSSDKNSEKAIHNVGAKFDYSNLSNNISSVISEYKRTGSCPSGFFVKYSGEVVLDTETAQNEFIVAKYSNNSEKSSHYDNVLDKSGVYHYSYSSNGACKTIYFQFYRTSDWNASNSYRYEFVKIGSDASLTNAVVTSIDNATGISYPSGSTDRFNAIDSYPGLRYDRGINDIFPDSSSPGEYPSSIHMCRNSNNESNTFIFYTGNLRTDAKCNAVSCDSDETGELPIKTDIPELKFCETTGVRMSFKIAGWVLFILKILVPLILIVMGIIDFAKAAISSEDKADSEAVGSLFRRVLLGIIIFFIPTILNLVFSLVDGFDGVKSDFADCTTCLLDPGNCSNSTIDGS